MAKTNKCADPLADLLAAAQPVTLVKLIVQLAAKRPDIRRECFDYLKKHVTLSAEQKVRSEGEIVLALWRELAPDLEELDDCGGGDWGTADQVADLLEEILKKMSGKKIDEKVRQEILDEVLPYIKSCNSGLDDNLYEVAYAACYSDEDLHWLAEELEGMGQDSTISQARKIYRKIGDREKYLELRRKKMKYGGDYHDLATFYWDEGSKELALAVAEEGMEKGEGRLDELRQFLSQRALDAGDRNRYLALQFAQATDHLILDSYKKFKKICTHVEWSQFESEMLGLLDKAWDTEQLKIRMHRKEYEQAVALIAKMRYSLSDWDNSEELQAAKKLESLYPEEILRYYLSGLGNLSTNAARKEYTLKAKLMVKVRHVYLDVLKSEERWKAFAGKVKRDNLRRPAFQEEFGKFVPGWREIV